MPIRSAGAGEDRKLKAVIEGFQERPDIIDGTINRVTEPFLSVDLEVQLTGEHVTAPIHLRG
jgi:hypothetical protein